LRGNASPLPLRRPYGVPRLKDGTISTDRPNTTWGADGIRSETVGDDRGRVLPEDNHYDARFVGIRKVLIPSS
jgi:hypothetical protein